MRAIAIGTQGVATLRVGVAHTAAALGSGDVPVFGTPALVALLEQAAVQALQGALAPEETTVGTAMQVNHLAASPVGAEIRAEADLVAIEGRMVTFTVRAFDPQEKIAEGEHRRVVVLRDRFLKKTEGKRRTA